MTDTKPLGAQADATHALSAFRQSVTDLERLQANMASVTAEAGQDWKRELIQLRRDVQIQLTAVRQIAEQGNILKDQPDLWSGFMKAFANMRATLALHQADWPDVKIELSDSVYQQSVANIRDANRAFCDLARDIFPLFEKSTTSTIGDGVQS
jgi:hypothetical protein